MIRAIQITICMIIITSIVFQSGVWASEPPIRTGARALGLCNTFTALADDASAPLWNSAGLAKANDFRLELDLFGDLLAMSYRLKDYGGVSAYALSRNDSNFIPFFDTDKEQDNQFGVAYGKGLGGFLLGAGLDYKLSKAGNDMGLNTGFISNPIPQLSIGMDFRLFFDEVSKQKRKLSYLAKHTTFSMALRPVEYLRYRPLDVALLASMDTNMNRLAFGTEFKYRFFSLRGGTSFKVRASELDSRMTLGLGLESDYGQVNFAYLSDPISKDRQYTASITLNYPKSSPESEIVSHSIPATSITASEIAHDKIEPLDTEWSPHKPKVSRKLFRLKSKTKYPKLEIAVALTHRYPWRAKKIRYVVKKGDSLWSICQKFQYRIFPKKYRDYKELAKWNMLDSPDHISPGDQLVIPVSSVVRQAGRGGYESVLEKLNQALENNPNNPVILNNLAAVFVKRGEIYVALEKLEKAVKLAPDRPVLNNNLGLLYIYAQKDDLAERYLKKAVKSMPKLTAVHCNLGLFYLESDRIDKAISELTTSLSLDEKCFDAMYNLAIAYEKKGMKKKARKTLTHLAEMVPDDQQVKQKLEEVSP